MSRIATRAANFEQRAKERMSSNDVEGCWYFRGCADAARGEPDPSVDLEHVYRSDYLEGYTDESAKS